MKSKVQCIGVLATLCMAPVAKGQDVDFYGKINLGYQYSKEGQQSDRELKSNASRIGIKGVQSLEGFDVFYKLEWQVDIANLDSDDNISSRNQYIGIRGRYGELVAGRNDTLFKRSQGKVDLFNDYTADLKHRWKGENRLGETLTYITPQMGEFSAGVTYVINDPVTGASSHSYQLSYGDASLKRNTWYASVAVDDDVKGIDATRLIVSTKLASAVLGLGAQRQTLADGESQQGWLLSVKGNYQTAQLKFQVQSMEEDVSTTVGIDYPFSKNVLLYAWYTHGDEDLVDDSQWFSTGIQFKF